MEENSSINLKRFIPQKASKWLLLKIVFYVLVLGILFYLLFTTSSRKTLKEPVTDEIQNIKIIQ
jgi:flagellar basal body-associated protein FliL